MRRIQFFEIEDQNWVPAFIRDGITDFLQFAVDQGDLYKGFADRLASALRKTNTRQVVDLCSGGGGPLKSLRQHIPELQSGRIRIHVTDYYPNLPAFSQLAASAPQSFSYSSESVSALDVPVSLQGFRTLFSSFHHFNPKDATRILQDAVEKRQGIAIAESTQRHILLLIYMLLVPILVILTSLFQNPFRWSRLFWTYIIPVIPLLVAFDGFVSCLRTYTPDELMDMVHAIPDHTSYDWQAGIEKIGFLPVGVTYLIGTPK